MSGERKSLFFCFCGPAGSGKSTVCRELVNLEANVRLSISTTTRSPRGAEVDGREYYFVTDEEFEKRLAAGRFIEHASFDGKQYGTEKTNFERANEEGTDLLLDIEIQGVRQLKSLFPDQTVTIYIFPPTLEVLEKRFRSRGTESEEKIQSRLRIAQEEISVLESPGFADYHLLNDDFEETVKSAREILSTERAGRTRR